MATLFRASLYRLFFTDVGPGDFLAMKAVAESMKAQLQLSWETFGARLLRDRLAAMREYLQVQIQKH